MLQGSATNGHAEKGRAEDRFSDVLPREKVSTESTQMDLSLLPNCTSDVCCLECPGLGDVKCFEAITVDGKNLVIYNRSRFKRDTALGA